MSFLINRPKFFKIILKPEANNLIIPTEFTIKYGCELTDHVFLNVPSGKLWEVKLIKSADEILFEKGWEKFRDHYSVEFGYFLVFVYDGDSRFSVFMFDRTCTEIDYPFEDNDKETESESKSESDGSVVILDENWKSKTKKSSKGQEGSDGSLKKKLKIQEITEKSADKLKLDGDFFSLKSGEYDINKGGGGGGGGSGVGSKLNVSHIMKTRRQAKLDLLNDFAKKIRNSENERNQVEGQQKKGETNSYSLKRLK